MSEIKDRRYNREDTTYTACKSLSEERVTRVSAI